MVHTPLLMKRNLFNVEWFSTADGVTALRAASSYSVVGKIAPAASNKLAVSEMMEAKG